MRKDDYSIWFDKYKPKLDGNGELLKYETFGDDLFTLNHIDNKFIWTIIEGDSGKWYISPGFHIVNRINYVVTEIPHDEKTRDYLYL